MLSFTIGRSTISVFLDGEFFTIDDSHANYSPLLDELRKPSEERDLNSIRDFVTIRNMIEAMSFGRVSIDDAAVYFEGNQVNNYMTQRMLEIIQQGLDIEPWARFMDNVFDNPAAYARDELYEWMEKANMPLTPDGCFLAFKKVRGNYMDCHTGRFDNSPGNILEMSRESCDTNRHNHCSSGFHFCSVGYLGSFGGQRVVVVKINPRDVTSIPSDYQFTKGRTCRYEVVAELTQENAAHHGVWRKGIVNLEDPAEFPADVLAKIKLPSPALNEPVTIIAESDPSTREQWEAWDLDGTNAAVTSGAITATASAEYLAAAKLRYDAIFDTHGELLSPTEYTNVADVIASEPVIGSIPGVSIVAGKTEDGASTVSVQSDEDYIAEVSGGDPTLAADIRATLEQEAMDAADEAADDAEAEVTFTTSDGREFGADVIKAALAEASIRGAARNLGIQDSTLRGWKKKLGL